MMRTYKNMVLALVFLLANMGKIATKFARLLINTIKNTESVKRVMNI